MENYAFISQTELREVLNKHGMKTTSQTLRDWERQGILLPPERGNKIMGRDARYSEFALAECFAAHHLIKGDLFPMALHQAFLPKFTLLQLAQAAKHWRKSGRYLIDGYPDPPTQSYAQKLPPSKATKEPRLITVQLPSHILSEPHIEQKTKEVMGAFAKLSTSAWIWAVSIGCELLLPHYRKV